MAETENKELKTYRGNCHCGAFVYEATLPELKKASECNCSLCYKKAYLFTQPEGDIRVIKGAEKDLAVYTFGAGDIQHKFCGQCGTGLLGRNEKWPPERQVAINVRAFQGVNAFDLEIGCFNGKDLPCDYKVPEYEGPEPSANIEGAKVYRGGCHCGAITLAFKTKPLDESYCKTEKRFTECNCSTCQRGGYIWVYPKADQLVIQGRENLSTYTYINKEIYRTFCKTCGVQLTTECSNLSEEDIKALPEDKAWLADFQLMKPLNLRVLKDLDVKQLKTAKYAGWDLLKPEYVNP